MPIDLDDDDAEAGVCRDELCPLEYIHPSHVFPLHESPPNERPWWAQRDPIACRKPDPEGLRASLHKIFNDTDWPLQYRDIAAAVRGDYGSVSPRSLHRYLERLAKTNFILVLDLKLAYVAYIRADSPRRQDTESLRDYVLGRREGASLLDRQVSCGSVVASLGG